jgi:hypothetical protein
MYAAGLSGKAAASMATYFGYFLGGEQVLTLTVVGVLWLGLAALGGLAAGRRAERELWPFFGWGLVSLLFIAGGTLASVSFTLMAWLSFLAAIGAAVFVVRRDGTLLPAGVGRQVVLAAPLLMLAGAMLASQWDEFSHWLPSIRFLTETDGFPSRSNPVTGTPMLPAYPYNWPLLSFLAGKLSGQFMEGAGRVLNLLFLMMLGLLAARMACRGAGREDAAQGWAFAGLALLAATILNPAFVQKIVLTSYADIATAVLTALCGYLVWRITNALAADDQAEARRLAWQFGLVATALVNVKQVNLILMGAVMAGALAIAWRDPAVRFPRLARLAPAMLVLPMAAYLLWRSFVAREMAGIAGAEATFMPLADWNFQVAHKILYQMIAVWAKKTAYLVLMLAALAVALRAMVRVRGEFDRLAIILATAFVGYNIAFMFVIYLGSFAEKDALRAVSFWRYSIPLAPLGVLFGAYGLGILWKRHVADRRLPAWLPWLPPALAVATTLVLAPKLRFDHEIPKPRYNQAALYIARSVPASVPLHIVNGNETIEPEVFTRARANRPSGPVLTNFGIPGALDKFMDGIEPGHLVLIHAAPAPLPEVLGLEIVAATSYLAWKEADGRLRVLRQWSEDGRVRVISPDEPWKKP